MGVAAACFIVLGIVLIFVAIIIDEGWLALLGGFLLGIGIVFLFVHQDQVEDERRDRCRYELEGQYIDGEEKDYCVVDPTIEIVEL